jgi:hypothetical protein
LRSGKFLLISTSGQNWLESVDFAISESGFKMLRIDSVTLAAARAAGDRATKEQLLVLLFTKNPKEAVREARSMGYRAISITPTCETGISIDNTHFDLVIEYAPAGTPSASLQRLARDRNNATPRIVFASDRAADYRADIDADADRILKSWKLNARQGFNAAQVLESLNTDQALSLATKQDKLLAAILRFSARDLAIQNESKRNLNANIEALLIDSGHNVTRDSIEITEETRQLWKAAKQELEKRKRETFAKAPVVSIDQAHEILRAGTGTREQVFSAQKTITLENYPGLDLDNPDLVGRLMFDRRGAALAAYTQAWLLKHPSVAQHIDRACWKGQLDRGIIWVPALKREALKVQSLADTGILEVLALEEYSEESPEVQALRSRCIQNRTQLRRICGYAAAFDDSHTGIQMVGWVARRLGHEQVIVRKVGPRGKQEKFWKAIDRNPSDRSIVEAALNLKWQDAELPQDKGSSSGSLDFPDSKSHTKIKATRLLSNESASMVRDFLKLSMLPDSKIPEFLRGWIAKWADRPNAEQEKADCWKFLASTSEGRKIQDRISNTYAQQNKVA